MECASARGLGGWAASVMAVVCMLGCAHNPKTQTAAAPERSGSGADTVVELRPAEGAQQQGQRCEIGTVYFDLDSAAIDERSRETLLAVVTCFTRNGTPAQIRLTGATDPRGTEEYNLALGQRRAAAVQSMLVMLGVAAPRISVSSAGEEMATGSDEAGWRLDRHVVASSEP